MSVWLDGIVCWGELEFPLSEERPIKGVNLFFVGPEGKPWQVDGNSREIKNEY